MATYFANCNTLNLDVSVNRGVSESCVSESWRTANFCLKVTTGQTTKTKMLCH